MHVRVHAWVGRCHSLWAATPSFANGCEAFAHIHVYTLARAFAPGDTREYCAHYARAWEGQGRSLVSSFSLCSLYLSPSLSFSLSLPLSCPLSRIPLFASTYALVQYRRLRYTGRVNVLLDFRIHMITTRKLHALRMCTTRAVQKGWVSKRYRKSLTVYILIWASFRVDARIITLLNIHESQRSLLLLQWYLS